MKAELVNWLPWSVFMISGAPCIMDGFFQYIDTCIGRQAVRQAPSEYAACCPVEHRRQIHKASAQRNVRRIHCPNLDRLIDGEAAQQVGLDPLRLVVAGRGEDAAGVLQQLRLPLGNPVPRLTRPTSGRP